MIDSERWDNRTGSTDAYVKPKRQLPKIEAYQDGSFWKARIHMPGCEPEDVPYCHADTRIGAIRYTAYRLRTVYRESKYEVIPCKKK